MRVLALFPPRSDGTIIARVDGEKYIFTQTDAGMICDLPEPHAQVLLSMPDRFRKADLFLEVKERKLRKMKAKADGVHVPSGSGSGQDSAE